MTREAPDDGFEDLDVDDPAIDALPADTRAVVAAVWTARASSELEAGSFFGAIAAAARERATAPEVAYLLARAASDEVAHAEICRRVASRYLAAPQLARTDSPARELPIFGNAPPSLNTTLNIVINSCISETVAAQFLRECREETRGLVAKRALRLLLRDEIDHARVGWAHLASSQVADDERVEVAKAAPVLIRAAREAWTRRTDASWTAALGHGFLSDARVTEIFDEVVRDVIVPGLSHVGIDVRWASGL